MIWIEIVAIWAVLLAAVLLFNRGCSIASSRNPDIMEHYKNDFDISEREREWRDKR